MSCNSHTSCLVGNAVTHMLVSAVCAPDKVKSSESMQGCR